MPSFFTALLNFNLKEIWAFSLEWLREPDGKIHVLKILLWWCTLSESQTFSYLAKAYSKLFTSKVVRMSCWLLSHWKKTLKCICKINCPHLILNIKILLLKAFCWISTKTLKLFLFIKSLSFGITFNYQTLTKKFEKFGAESLRVLARVVQKVDNAIHRINHYPMDSVVCFVNTYPLDSDLSSG